MTAEKIINRDIIITGQQPWDVEIGSNCKNIAVELSKYNRVLYMNPPLDRVTLIKNKHDPKIKKRLDIVKGKQESLVQIKDNLWNLYPDRLSESVSFIKNHSIFNLFNRINNKRIAASLNKAIKTLGFKHVILFNDNDIYRSFYLKDLLHPAISIYYSRDFMLSVDYWKRHGEKLEPKLIAKSDLCVANSTYLAEYCRKYNANSYYVGQGCELDIFMDFKGKDKPADMQQIKAPVIGYTGALQSLRLNLDIILHIAQVKPEWSIVLVGPEDEQFKKSNLHSLPNVYFLGLKKPESLPEYINEFDVCINPQLVNQVTIGNYPRKIDEYLAMGKPVVATRTETMSIFEAHTYLAENKEDYITLISLALAEDDEAKRQARKNFASLHTWENSVNEIYSAIGHSAKPLV